MQEVHVIENIIFDSLYYAKIQLAAIDADGSLVREFNAQSCDQDTDKLIQMYRAIFIETLKMDNYKVTKLN